MEPKSEFSKTDIYLYGMTVLSNIHLLNEPYPKADTYGEIKESYTIPGGETGNSAVILANLGYNVKIDGPFLGTKTKDGILDFYKKYSVDCSNLYFDPSFEGVQDLVLIDKDSRTVFGEFAKYFSGDKRWSKPDYEAIQSAKIVALDPYFGEESILVANHCSKIGKKYVTIDCLPDSVLHQNSASTIISKEFMKDKFPNEEILGLFKKYADASNGLVIFTQGSSKILYGRKGEEDKSILPYKVDVKSTLGAGDTFRAGVVYGILNNFSDENAVKFAAATAASVCKRFPMAIDPPGLDEIMGLVQENI